MPGVDEGPWAWTVLQQYSRTPRSAWLWWYGLVPTVKSSHSNFGEKIHLTVSCHHCFSSRSFGDQWPACGLVSHLDTSGLLFFSLLLWVYIQLCERARRKLQRKGVQCTTGLPHNLSQKIAFIFLLEKLAIKFLSCLCTDLDNSQPLPELLNKSGLRETHVPVVMDISRHSLSLPSQAHLF